MFLIIILASIILYFEYCTYLGKKYYKSRIRIVQNKSGYYIIEKRGNYTWMWTSRLSDKFSGDLVVDYMGFVDSIRYSELEDAKIRVQDYFDYMKKLYSNSRNENQRHT